MVYTRIDHRNDAIKCSKLTWNKAPQASGFTANIYRYYCQVFDILWHRFYGLQEFVLQQHGKIQAELALFFIGKCARDRAK